MKQGRKIGKKYRLCKEIRSFGYKVQMYYLSDESFFWGFMVTELFFLKPYDILWLL